jgi:hypothetical protein
LDLEFFEGGRGEDWGIEAFLGEDNEFGFFGGGEGLEEC